MRRSEGDSEYRKEPLYDLYGHAVIPEAFFYFLLANFEARSGESRIAEPKNETLWSNNNFYFFFRGHGNESCILIGC